MPEAERMSDAQSMFDALKTHGLEKVKITGNWIELKAPVPFALLVRVVILRKRETEKLVRML